MYIYTYIKWDIYISHFLIYKLNTPADSCRFHDTNTPENPATSEVVETTGIFNLCITTSLGEEKF